MTVVRGLVLALGIVLLVMNAASTIRILIVPRAATGVATMPMRSVRVAFRRLARLARSYVAKDRVLALSEPVALMVQLGTWLVTSVVGFMLVIWGLGSGTLSAAFIEAGSSVSTLGFAHGVGHGNQTVDFVAAGTGMVLVALPDRLSAHHLQRI